MITMILVQKKHLFGQFLAVFFWFLHLSSAFAHQRARIINNGTEIHTLPSRESPVVQEFTSGKSVRVSSKWVTDTQRQNWYKVLLPAGGYGYVQANQLETEKGKRELASVNLHTHEGRFEENSTPTHTWRYVLRMMGTFSTSTNSLDVMTAGGELEFNYGLTFEREGTMAHLISLGAFLSSLTGNAPNWGGVIVIRPPPLLFTLQTEIRLRVGGFSISGGPLFTLIGGIQYPFSLYYGLHLSGYAEVGASTFQAFNSILPFASLGVGVHF
jgi:hypothetical protein